MIVSFGDKETEKIFNRKRSKKLPSEIQRNALRKLNMIDAASIVKDLEVPPGNRLEKLEGELSDYHSRDSPNSEFVFWHFSRLLAQPA